MILTFVPEKSLVCFLKNALGRARADVLSETQSAEQKKTPLTAGTVNGGKESQMETLALVLIMIFLIIQSMKNQ